MTRRTATDARSVPELVRVIQSGVRPRFVFFWGHQAGGGGQLDSACLSQWWPASFAVDGAVFRSAEQYMMWRKAVLFDDHTRAAAVLKSRSPAQAKVMGRQVAGFKEAVWAQHRWEIVVSASVAKFDSDPALRSFLLSTGKRVLAEASPVDRVWGIGLSADSEFASQPQRWKGLNLLGFALMEARQRLAAG